MSNRLEKATAVAEELRDQVSRQPYLTLGLTLGVGYFVGRGVSMSMLATVLGVSARVIVGSTVESYLRDPLARADRRGFRKKEDRSECSRMS